MKRVTAYFFFTLIGCQIFAQQVTSEQTIVLKMYESYESYATAIGKYDYRTAQTVYNHIREQYDNLDSRDKNRVRSIIIDDLISSFQNKNNTESVYDAERALIILPKDDETQFNVLIQLSEIYLHLYNKGMLSNTLSRIRNIPRKLSQEELDIVNSFSIMADSMDDVQEVIPGIWVSANHSKKSGNVGEPLLALDISKKNNQYTANIFDFSSFKKKVLNNKEGQLKVSCDFSCNPSIGFFSFSFMNRSVNHGNRFISNVSINAAEDSHARFDAYANREEWTAGQSAATLVAGEVSSTVLQLIGLLSATSKMKEDNLVLSGSIAGKNRFSSLLLYQKQKTNSYSSTAKERIEEWSFDLLRWSYNDHVYFSNAKCQPLSPWTYSLRPDMELYHLKRKTSFWNAKFFLPMLAGIASSIGIAYGIAMKNSSQNNELNHENESYFNNQKNLSFIIAGVGTTLSIVIPISIQHVYRKKAVQDYNQRQYAELIRLNQER